MLALLVRQMFLLEKIEGRSNQTAINVQGNICGTQCFPFIFNSKQFGKDEGTLTVGSSSP